MGSVLPIYSPKLETIVIALGGHQWRRSRVAYWIISPRQIISTLFLARMTPPSVPCYLRLKLIPHCNRTGHDTVRILTLSFCQTNKINSLFVFCMMRCRLLSEALRML